MRIIPEQILYSLFAFILGSCFGSFFKVVVDRHGKEGYFIGKPSHCLSCKTNLSWWQNIPIISYFLLKGKCHFCKASIDPECFYSELIVGLFSATLYLTGVARNQNIGEIALLLFFFLTLILLSMFDLKHRTIPHFISYTAITIIILISSILGKPIPSLFKNLGIAFIFLDSLYVVTTVLKRFKLEFNSICIPLLLWTIYYFFFDYKFFIAVSILIFYLLIRQKIPVLMLLTFWALLIMLVGFQVYRLIFSGFQFDKLFSFFSGIGIIYFACEIVYYYLCLFFPQILQEDEEAESTGSESTEITIGGGDITTFALISIFLGNKGAFLTLFSASLLATISHFTIRAIGPYLKIPKEKHSQYVPFVPFLTIACFIIIITINGK